MHVKSGAGPGIIDAIAAMEGKFRFRPGLDQVPTAEVVMVYLNSTTKTTYGQCPFFGFSPRTQEALLEFLKCAEQDFANVVFDGGVLTPFGPVMTSAVLAESNVGLPLGLGQGGKHGGT